MTGQDEFKKWISALRNDFHRHPELSTLEKRTTEKICEVLKTLNVPTRTFDDLTGAVGLLQGSKKGSGETRTIALRADIDALPVQEPGDKSNKSVNDGVMHACGHDAIRRLFWGWQKKSRIPAC